MHTRRSFSLSGVFCAASLLNSTAVALTSYGDFGGDTVIFRAVTENSITDPMPLYSPLPPTVAADTLVFTPVAFGASANGANGVDLTDGSLRMVIEARPGGRIDNIVITETGDYTLVGAGTAATFAAVGTPVFVSVLEVNGVGIRPVKIQANVQVTPSDGDYDLVADGATVASVWQGFLDIDVFSALGAASIPGSATKVLLTMDNTLAATSETGTLSSISKKGMEIASVPEPSTMILALAGSLGLLRVRRRVARRS